MSLATPTPSTGGKGRKMKRSATTRDTSGRRRRDSVASVASLDPSVLLSIAHKKSQQRLTNMETIKSETYGDGGEHSDSEDSRYASTGTVDPYKGEAGGTEGDERVKMINLFDLEEHFKGVEAQILELEDRVEELESQNGTLRDELTDSRDETENISRDCDNLRDLVESLNQEIEQYRVMLENSEGRVKESMMTVTELQQRLEHRMGESAEEATQMDHLSSEVATLRVKNSDLSSENESLKVEQSRMNREISILQAKLQDSESLSKKNVELSRRVQSLEATLKASEEDKEALKEILDEADAEIQLIEIQREQLEKQLKDLTKDGGTQTDTGIHRVQPTIVFSSTGGTGGTSGSLGFSGYDDTASVSSYASPFSSSRGGGRRAQMAKVNSTLSVSRGPGSARQATIMDLSTDIPAKGIELASEPPEEDTPSVMDFEQESKHREEDRPGLGITELLAAAAKSKSKTPSVVPSHDHSVTYMGGHQPTQIITTNPMDDEILVEMDDKLEGLKDVLDTVKMNIDQLLKMRVKIQNIEHAMRTVSQGLAKGSRSPMIDNNGTSLSEWNYASGGVDSGSDVSSSHHRKTKTAGPGRVGGAAGGGQSLIVGKLGSAVNRIPEHSTFSMDDRSVASGRSSSSLKPYSPFHRILLNVGVKDKRSRIQMIEWITAGTLSITLFGVGFLVIHTMRNGLNIPPVGGRKKVLQ